MTNGIEGEGKYCTYQWKIKNASNCLLVKSGKELRSPTFIADALVGTKWFLTLYSAGEEDENYMACYLYRAKDCMGPDVIDVYFELAFLGEDDGEDGTILVEEIESKHRFAKGKGYGFWKLVENERVFVTEKEKFIPEDILIVQCTFRQIKTDYLYGQTVIKERTNFFIWRMGGFSSNKSGLRKNFKDVLYEFDFIWNEDFDRLDLKRIACDSCIENISFNISIINFEGKKENCGIKSYFATDLQIGVLSPVVHFPKKILENKSRYLPNDTLSLDIEIAITYIESFDSEIRSAGLEKDTKINKCSDKAEKFQNSEILVNELKSMYIDGIFSDMELRTATKTFPAHRSILSARSPVFKRMFSNDMKEANSGHVDISDFEDDTVHRMLLYIYTGTLEDLQFESAIDLYKIADKYEILSFQNKCSDYLKDNLCTTNVCDVFTLADSHKDEDLKSAAQTYILDHNEMFKSLEWENFMESNIKLAADIMYKKLNPDKVPK